MVSFCCAWAFLLLSLCFLCVLLCSPLFSFSVSFCFPFGLGVLVFSCWISSGILSVSVCFPFRFPFALVCVLLCVFLFPFDLIFGSIEEQIVSSLRFEFEIGVRPRQCLRACCLMRCFRACIMDSLVVISTVKVFWNFNMAISKLCCFGVSLMGDASR